MTKAARSFTQHVRGTLAAAAMPARSQPVDVANAAMRRVLRRSGYFVVKSGIDLTVKVNTADPPKGFYDNADAWHFTLGDGDMDH